MMLRQPLKVTRALLVLATLLGTTGASFAADITPAPTVVRGQPQPMYIPQGGG
ncbi:MAG: hypothetical protein WDN69_36085 [Aliidongia sp.]